MSVGRTYYSSAVERAERQGSEWFEQAACKGKTGLFFPEKGGAHVAAAAKAICAECPARGPCLEYALTARIAEGIWGGATEDERKRIRRRRAS